jgi:hypothetical protein
MEWEVSAIRENGWVAMDKLRLRQIHYGIYLAQAVYHQSCYGRLNDPCPVCAFAHRDAARVTRGQCSRG